MSIDEMMAKARRNVELYAGSPHEQYWRSRLALLSTMNKNNEPVPAYSYFFCPEGTQGALVPCVL